jgi:hypothetical protein
MFTTRSMIVLSAVAATGIVLLTQPSHSEQTVGVEHVKLQDRYPAFNVGNAIRDALNAERGVATPAPESTPKADQLNVVIKDCDSYTWPKIPTACLNLAGDGTGNQAPRRVQIEDRPSDRISIVTMAPTIVAQR